LFVWICIANYARRHEQNEMKMWRVNFPGSWKDGSICSNILLFIGVKIAVYKFSVEQGFRWRGDVNQILVAPISHKLTKKYHQFSTSLSFVYQIFVFHWGMHVYGEYAVTRIVSVD
jgi:hypothetical protein